MAVQRTLSIIKPDATRRRICGCINAHLEGAKLNIIAQKRVQLLISRVLAIKNHTSIQGRTNITGFTTRF